MIISLEKINKSTVYIYKGFYRFEITLAYYRNNPTKINLSQLYIYGQRQSIETRVNRLYKELTDE